MQLDGSIACLPGVSNSVAQLSSLDRAGTLSWRWYSTTVASRCELHPTLIQGIRPSATEKDFRVPARIIYTGFGASAI